MDRLNLFAFMMGSANIFLRGRQTKITDEEIALIASVTLSLLMMPLFPSLPSMRISSFELF